MSDSPIASALRLCNEGRFAEASQICTDVLRSNPKQFEALYLLGFMHLQHRRFAEAERLLGEALKVNPGSLDAHYNYGRALHSLGRLDEAIAAYDRLLARNPRIGEAWLNRGIAAMEFGRPREALLSFDRALALEPNTTEAWHNRGNTLGELGRFDEAVQSFGRALELRPDLAEAWNNRGNALAKLRRTDDAVASYAKAIALQPANPELRNNRALVLFENRRFDDAAREYREVLRLSPDYQYARGNLAFCELQCCEWASLASEKAEFAEKVRAGERVIAPIQFTSLSDSPSDQLLCARIMTSDKYPASANPLWRGERYGHGKIRVAYLSADFHSHATAALMSGVFEAHDRSRFETVAISFGPDERSPMRSRLKAGFDRFLDVTRQGDREVAELLRRSEIDIAVDLKGYTQEARPGILTFRPAPVQAQYLGFPGTMGADYIDYIIADETVIPEGDQRFYAEKVVYLPDSYQANDSKRRIAEKMPSRAEAGLPEDGFVFCSFNNTYKLAPDIFTIWMRLLSAVEGSVLWLLQDNAAATRNLKREAEARGVSAARLAFAPRTDVAEHLARQRLADLFLDTLPYGAHTTASDALWAGLPVLTCLGKTFSGRVAASLLKAMGLPELITTSLADYEALALKLARDKDALAAVKAKLAMNRDSAALFDTAGFTRNLEVAYIRMWERASRGEAPAAFTV
ncbi:MAG TPA: tetratricopeptide repeat protein [Micropepsaceae bacterium]|nr:tetratricopeptide repeat protein [Micropepsaceae bacterium]